MTISRTRWWDRVQIHIYSASRMRIRIHAVMHAVSMCKKNDVRKRMSMRIGCGNMESSLHDRFFFTDADAIARAKCALRARGFPILLCIFTGL